jgi:hypothetical protein
MRNMSECEYCTMTLYDDRPRCEDTGTTPAGHTLRCTREVDHPGAHWVCAFGRHRLFHWERLKMLTPKPYFSWRYWLEGDVYLGHVAHYDIWARRSDKVIDVFMIYGHNDGEYISVEIDRCIAPNPTIAGLLEVVLQSAEVCKYIRNSILEDRDDRSTMEYV